MYQWREVKIDTINEGKLIIICFSVFGNMLLI